MPGIVGLVTKRSYEWAAPQLLRMVETIRHESFYCTGTWADQASGVYVGWTVLKNSFSDGMPLCNERGDVVLVFSGEEYSETAPRPLKGHHGLPTQGPSYLVQRYEEEPTFPAGLNGRFHGLVSDRNWGTVTLFNDRYGMHRIYWYESRDAFYFASEAKAILAVRSELRGVDPKALGEFIACGCVLEDRTVFDGIRVLPPASAWIFRNGSIDRKGLYFQPKEWEEQAPLDPESYYQELREIFSVNLPRYFNGRERVGMSLTGGLDTRMVMAWERVSPGSLPCYSFGGMFRESQDVIVARRVAKACSQSHDVIAVGEEFLSHFAEYVERTVYLSDGCAAVNRAADLYLNERARQIAPVRMTGNYGGEVLRRVRAFKPGPVLPGLFCPELLSYVRQAAETYTGLLQGHPLSFAVFRQAPWHHYGLLALEQTQLSLRTPYLDNDLVRMVFRAPESACLNNDVCLRLIADGNPTLMQIRSDQGLAGDHGRLPAAIIRSFLEFTFKAEYAYDYGMPQRVAQMDHLFSRLHFERLFLGRHKFCHFRIWYRDALSKYVREMLLDSRTLSRPYLERGMVETVVERHIKGDRNYTSEIHMVLTLELLLRLFLDPR